ncbi:glycosyltransferase [Sulfurovum sp. XTW-4]|uniref:Glycosyltransferase n=1 Tax=Sulfurovum xiamenensis TaxID=3019066 RepID=A0ABT7QNI1_9BACT|nr:glycosyltransferase [Sulfurovum xiamenensis]MDM5262630.1 glycosyltransferase [Sulfurovum xiamenensis]
MNELGVSVVIPTLNRDEFLYDSINDMLKQDFDKYEILVVDQSDNINEKVEELVKSNPDKIRYFRNLGFKGLPQARNFGWQNAKYEIILYIDDDIRSNELLIKQHASCYVDLEVGLVGGGIDEQHRVLDAKEPSGIFNPWTCTPHRGFASKNNQIVSHVPGGNFSVRKEIMEKVNGVDEVLNVGAALYEETDLSLRIKKLGYKILFKADARLLHLAADTGGCRVISDIPRYMRGLAHNRSLVISRHLKWYHKITAFFRLMLLGVSYSRVDRSLNPLFATFNGIKAGRKAGLNPVVCCNYRVQE